MKALERDVKKRFSAEQLLNHKWIIDQSSHESLDEDDQIEIMTNLTNFSKASKFQKTIISLLMGLKAEK